MVPIAIGLALTAVGLALAVRLQLKTSFEHLLPENASSVVELRRITALAPSTANVFVVLEGKETARLRALGDEIVVRLRERARPLIEDVEDGVHEARRYLLPRVGLFAKVEELERLVEDINALWDYEVGKKAGTLLDDEGPPVTVKELRGRFHVKDREGDRFKDGYYQSKDGHALVVNVRSTTEGGDLERAQAVLDRVKAIVAGVAARGDAARGIKIGFAGNLVTQIAEYGAVKRDLTQVGLIGSVLVLGVTLLFFMRLRVLTAMGLTIATGLAWTFGLTQVAIGHLNLATGFLFSIVVGNGINSGIIFMSRYFEERRLGSPAEESILTAIRATWLPTLTAALAAAAAYGALGVTDFRSFKHFALIGAAGMVLCWVATFVMLPPILVVMDRRWSFKATGESWFQRLRLYGLRYDAPFAALVKRAPRTIAVLGILLSIAGLAGIVPYIRSDPMEYDMRQLQNDLADTKELYRVATLAADILGAKLESSMVVVAERLDQVAPFKRLLEERRDRAPRGQKPFEAVHTLLDFIPESQEAKLPHLAELRRLLLKARGRGVIGDADWKELSQVLPPAGLKPITVADLPWELARPFTDRRGLRGTIALVEPTAGQRDSDLKYLMRWADSFRETRLPNGEVIRGSGRAVIFADMIRAVTADIPWAVGMSLGMTVLAVVLTFHQGLHSLAVLSALFMGIAWMALYLLVSGARIHFLNFIALPITFGIGVDYAVNFFQRYTAGKERSALIVLRTTGGAVVLCSLTTMLGYMALLGSINQAIRGLGSLAVMGEVTCLLAALLVAPAALFLWEQRKERREVRAAELEADPFFTPMGTRRPGKKS
jgi:uncharacterized protein